MIHGPPVAISVFITAFMLTGLAFAQPDPNKRVSLDLIEESIEEAMQSLSVATEFNILLSGSIQGTITAYIRDMSAERALEEIVRVNGLHYVRNDDVVWILSDREYFEGLDLGHERRVIRLRHTRAVDVAAILQSHLSSSARVSTYPEANVLVVADVPERFAAIEELILELDRATDTRVIQLDHATAAEMVALLQNHVTSPASFQADARTNQIILTDTIENLDKLEGLIRKFDRADLVETRMYQLVYADAAEVAELLREVLTGRRRTPSQGAGGLSAPSERERPQVFTAPQSLSRPNSQSSFALRRGATPTTGSPRQTLTPNVEVSATPVVETSGSILVGTEEVALGPLSSIAADPRTNTIVITHTQAVLERLEAIIQQIDVPSQFHRYQFQFANPEELDLEARLAQLLPSQAAFLNVDALSSTVTFRAQGGRAEQILELLNLWDHDERQIVIEAQVLSVNVGLTKDLGISWQAIAENGGDMLDRAFDITVDFLPSIPAAPRGQLIIGNIANDDYTAVIQALTTHSDTQVIARPYITVRDGQQAIFSNARDEPFTVVTVDGNTDTTLQDVRFLNVGTTLTVAPNIHPNDRITLDVSLELSDLVEVRNGIPVVDRSTAQSSITVHDRGTLILGGLRQSSRSLTRRGVPGLSRIPILGGLFRNKRKDDAEFEVLLILRPRIVRDFTQEPAPLEIIHEDLKIDIEREITDDPKRDSEPKKERRRDSERRIQPQAEESAADAQTSTRNYNPRQK